MSLSQVFFIQSLIYKRKSFQQVKGSLHPFTSLPSPKKFLNSKAKLAVGRLSPSVLQKLDSDLAHIIFFFFLIPVHVYDGLQMWLWNCCHTSRLLTSGYESCLPANNISARNHFSSYSYITIIITQNGMVIAHIGK